MCATCAESLQALSITEIEVNGGPGANVIDLDGVNTDVNNFTALATVNLNGGPLSETFTISGTTTGVFFQRLTQVPFSIDIISPTENLILNGNDGDETVTGTTGLSGVITITVNGGEGNDLIKGGDGPDTLNGDDDNDTLIGFRGPDTMNGGEGNDTLIWNNGDGSDTMDGGNGGDLVIVNGGPLSETFTITPVVSLATAGADAPLVGSVLFQRLTQVAFSLDIEAEGVQVNGNDGDDTFDVVPLPNTQVTFNGGNQSVADVLRVNAQDNPAETIFNQIFVPGRQPVTFEAVERVEVLNDAFPWDIYFPWIRDWDAPSAAE